MHVRYQMIVKSADRGVRFTLPFKGFADDSAKLGGALWDSLQGCDLRLLGSNLHIHLRVANARAGRRKGRPRWVQAEQPCASEPQAIRSAVTTLASGALAQLERLTRSPSPEPEPTLVDGMVATTTAMGTLLGAGLEAARKIDAGVSGGSSAPASAPGGAAPSGGAAQPSAAAGPPPPRPQGGGGGAVLQSLLGALGGPEALAGVVAQVNEMPDDQLEGLARKAGPILRGLGSSLGFNVDDLVTLVQPTAAAPPPPAPPEWPDEDEDEDDDDGF